jgi:hypothetical protein
MHSLKEGRVLKTADRIFNRASKAPCSVLNLYFMSKSEIDTLILKMPSITSFLFRARGGELKPLLAVGSTLIASLWALRRVSAGPIRQLNGGRGGSFEFVDPRGKCVVVTGCDSGFGFLTAVELARLGFVVFAGVFNPDVSRTLLENELKALEADRNARNITGVTFGKILMLTLARDSGL